MNFVTTKHANWSARKYSAVCSEHFTEIDYERYLVEIPGKREYTSRLKKDDIGITAYPSVFKKLSNFMNEISPPEELEDNMQEEETCDSFETCKTSGANNIHVEEFKDSLLFEQFVNSKTHTEAQECEECKGLLAKSKHYQSAWLTAKFKLKDLKNEQKTINQDDDGEYIIEEEDTSQSDDSGEDDEEQYPVPSLPRSNGLGGGVAVYISEQINWTRRYDLESELECIWLEIFPYKTKSFLICSMYRPPDTSSYTHANFKNLFAGMLDLATANLKVVIVMGDLNVNYHRNEDNTEIKSIISVNGFKQIVKEATRTTENTATLIDIIITNNPSVIACTKVVPIAFSDHDLIGCVRKQHHLKYVPKVINCRNTKNYSKELMCDELFKQDWTPVYESTDVNYAWTCMKDIISSCFDKLASIIKKRIRGKPSPWLTDEIKKAMNTRDILLRKSRKTKFESDIIAYRKKRNE
ncbi:Hypothetical predicted protein, partial [Paramuricea clavata]